MPGNYLQVDKVIVESFRKESSELLTELARLVTGLENDPDESTAYARMEEFCQKIDRIRGGSKILSEEARGHVGLLRMGDIAELCRLVGQRATSRRERKFLPLVAAFWGESVEMLQDLMASLEDEERTRDIVRHYPGIAKRRLEWLFSRIAPGETIKSLDENLREVEDLLALFEEKDS
jgi:hypothetical protein